MPYVEFDITGRPSMSCAQETRNGFLFEWIPDSANSLTTVFDLLQVGDRSLLTVSYLERRERLAELDIDEAGLGRTLSLWHRSRRL